jgi:6-phosphogluconate dehydrogenase (decarboxylating)
MQVGMIGLGRMGANMARRLVRGGHECVVYDRSPDAVRESARDGSVGAFERFSSRGEADFQDRLLSAMRFQFGGHVEKGSHK